MFEEWEKSDFKKVMKRISTESRKRGWLKINKNTGYKNIYKLNPWVNLTIRNRRLLGDVINRIVMTMSKYMKLKSSRSESSWAHRWNSQAKCRNLSRTLPQMKEENAIDMARVLVTCPRHRSTGQRTTLTNCFRRILVDLMTYDQKHEEPATLSDFVCAA